MRVTGLILAASMLWLSPVNAGSTAVAERYVLSISGVDIGEADLTIKQRGDDYIARMQGGFRFLFWGGEGEAQSLGISSNAALEPSAYSSRFESTSRVFQTDISFGPGGAARATWEATPPFDPEDFGERVPLKDADLVGAKDMLSAFVIPAKSGVAACGQSLKVFSGIVRFDLDLMPLGQGEEGRIYCAARYRPIAGHRLKPKDVDRLQRDGLQLSFFELMPGIWAPHSVGFSTRFGTMTLTRAVE